MRLLHPLKLKQMKNSLRSNIRSVQKNEEAVTFHYLIHETNIKAISICTFSMPFLLFEYLLALSKSHCILPLCSSSTCQSPWLRKYIQLR